jgi:hypothetical protein
MVEPGRLLSESSAEFLLSQSRPKSMQEEASQHEPSTSENKAVQTQTHHESQMQKKLGVVQIG